MLFKLSNLLKYFCSAGQKCNPNWHINNIFYCCYDHEKTSVLCFPQKKVFVSWINHYDYIINKRSLYIYLTTFVLFLLWKKSIFLKEYIYIYIYISCCFLRIQTYQNIALQYELAALTKYCFVPHKKITPTTT